MLEIIVSLHYSVTCTALLRGVCTSARVWREQLTNKINWNRDGVTPGLRVKNDKIVFIGLKIGDTDRALFLAWFCLMVLS